MLEKKKKKNLNQSRFICPAMVAPEHYGVQFDLSKDARRNLMAASKVIQALANGISGFKEE